MQVLSLHFLESPVGNLGDIGLKYLTSQVELRMKLVVTGVHVKLKNQPDVLPKSSFYHPLLINNLDLHDT